MRVRIRTERIRKGFSCIAILLVLLFFCPRQSQAHPWGGLVIDQNGDIYFTFICPFTSDDHYACVWKLSEGVVTPALSSSQSPSDIILARNNNRHIFGAERTNAGQAYQARLWQFTQNEWRNFIPPTTEPSRFHIQTYAVDNAGHVYFARDHLLFRRNSEGEVNQVPTTKTFERIDLLAWGPDEALYIVEGGTLLKMDPGTGAHVMVASGLREEEPEDLPFSGANILFDMVVDDDGAVYLAYYGNRRILKVLPSGEITTFAKSDAPWSPHGIDVYNGEIYILESTVGRRSWWNLWGRPEIVPRVRKFSPDGTAQTLFEHEDD